MKYLMNALNKVPRNAVIFAVGICLGCITGCGFRQTPAANLGVDGPPGESNAPSEGGDSNPTPDPSVFALNVTIDPLPEQHCIGKDLEVRVIVFNFDDAISIAQFRTLEYEDRDFEVDMVWTVKLSGEGGETTTNPQPDHTTIFKPAGPAGDTPITASVQMVLREVGGGERIVVASGEDEFTIQLIKCPYAVEISYGGQFKVEDFWDRTETASTERIVIEAEGDGPYSGSGDLSVSAFQHAEQEGCTLDTAPVTGSSPVEINGDFDEDGENLVLDFDFQVIQLPDTTMTTNCAGESVTVSAAGWSADPSLWGITSLEFPGSGDSQTIPVANGFVPGRAAGVGSGVVSITIEPILEEATTSLPGYADISKLGWFERFWKMSW